MQKRDIETYQNRFRDFEILPKFSETHVFRGTIRHPYLGTPLTYMSNFSCAKSNVLVIKSHSGISIPFLLFLKAVIPRTMSVTMSMKLL